MNETKKFSSDTDLEVDPNVQITNVYFPIPSYIPKVCSVGPKERKKFAFVQCIQVPKYPLQF